MLCSNVTTEISPEKRISFVFRCLQSSLCPPAIVEAGVDFSFQKIQSHNSVAARFDQYIFSLLSDGHPNINTDLLGGRQTRI